MKKIFMSLFLMLIPMTTFSYKITNSPASTVQVHVVLTRGIRAPDNISILAKYWLNPGQSGAWNQDKIRKKKILKIKDFKVFVFKNTIKNWLRLEVSAKTIFKVEHMPINANLEILVVGQSSDQVIGGAVDYSTGKVYNQMGLDQAVQWLKRNRPDKLPSIASLMQQANIK